MLLNMSLSGVPFCGVDIGGFLGDTTAELLVRWYSAGIFYPFFRNHCALHTRPQEPWAFGKKVERLCRRLIETRYRLLPYLQSLFWEHLRTGAPIMRPLLWHYPRDPHASETDDEFLFGREILVAPILERGRTRRNVYLPAGRWYPFEGGKPLKGGRVHGVTFELGQVPAFVREGAILPLAGVVQSTADLPRAPITFTCFGRKAQGSFFEEDGSSFGYELGLYNEWRLTMANGRLEMRPLHLGLKKLQSRCRAASSKGAAIRIRS
jgi:alpha-glucosidase